MSTLINQISGFLLEPPGNLIYHLALVFIVSTSFQFSLFSGGQGASKKPSRIAAGLLILLASQLLVFLISALAWQGIIDSRIVLPPFDRAVFVFDLLWIIWLWVFPRKSRLADYATIGLSLAIIILLIITIKAWLPQSSLFTFNSSWLDWSWNVLSALVMVAGILLLLTQRPQNWGVGLAFININLLGIMVHVLWGNQETDFIAPLRLAQLCAFPLLPALVRRPIETGSPVLLPDQSQESIQKTIPAATSPQIKLWARLSSSPDKDSFYPQFSEALAATLSFEICVPFIKSSPRTLQFEPGYDSAQMRKLERKVIPFEQLPGIRQILQNGQTSILSWKQSAPAEIAILKEILQLDKLESDILIYMFNKKGERGVLLLSPYSKAPIQMPAEITFDPSFSAEMDRILLKPNTLVASPWSNEEYSSLLMRFQELQNKNADLEKEIEKLKPMCSETSNIGALIAIQQESQELIEKLQEENNQLRFDLHEAQTKARADEPLNLYSSEQQAEEKITHLETALSVANQRIFELENLHLSKTVEEKPQIQPPVNINMLIDEVVDEMGVQLLEKNIALQLDLPSSLPLVEIDSESLQLVLSLLLQSSARSVSKPEKINLHVQLLKENPIQGKLSIKIMDLADVSGQEVIPVSSVEETEKNVEINNSNMAIVKATVERLGGMIDVKPGKRGTTCSLLIPVTISPFSQPGKA